eukprot:Opistho-2@95171
MGNISARIIEIFENLFASSKVAGKVLMVGLDGAGKTTILYQLKLGDRINTIPTIGFNVETVELPGVSFCVWDVGGQTKIRPLWQHYFAGSDAIVFVVDSTDAERLLEAKEELAELAASPLLDNACFLILANKQDSPRAHGPRAVMDAIGAENLSTGKLRHRQWLVKGISAATGEGIIEAFHSLAAMMAKQRKIARAGAA